MIKSVSDSRGVFYWGVGQDNPEYLNKKIVLSNQIALLLGTTVAMPFIAISLIHFRPLTIIPIIGTLACFSTLLLNGLRLHNLARVVIAMIAPMLASIYGGFLSHAGQPVVPGIAMLTLVFSLTIFLIFDLREKALLIGVGAVVVFLIVEADFINDMLELDVPLEISVIVTGYLSKLTIIISVVVGGGSLLSLVVQNEKGEKELKNLLAQAEMDRRQKEEKERALQESLRKLELAREDEKKRQWSDYGLAKAVRIIRDTAEFNLLCNEFLSFTVKYSRANQGALFILNDSNERDLHLELKATYAYDKHQHLKKRIDIGVGQVGQAFLEKSHIYLKEIPENYVAIASGLGMAKPRSIIIMPLKVNDEVLGVMELASFQVLSPHEVAFLESLSEDLASAIKSRKITEKMASVLVKIQR